MNGEEKLINMQRNIKNMTPEERRKKVVKLENKEELKSIFAVKNKFEGYVVLPHGKEGFFDMNIGFNNFRTKEEIESLVDTDGAIDELNRIIEQKTIELADDLDYVYQFVTASNPGCVVTTDCYKKNYNKENIEITEEDCLDDIACIKLKYFATDERLDLEETNHYESYEGDYRLVHFNEFYKKVEDLGYCFCEIDPKAETPFAGYLESMINDYMPMDIETPNIVDKDIDLSPFGREYKENNIRRH